MRKARKVIGSLLSLTLILAQTCFASASPNIRNLVNTDIEDLSTKQIETYKNQIEQLSDQQYDQFIADLMRTSTNYAQLKKALQAVGVEISDIKTSNSLPEKNGVSTRATPINQATISCSASRRAGETIYHLVASYWLSTAENRPGSYDVVLMYFNSQIANYYSYGCDSNYSSLKSGQYATSGTLAFNFDDASSGTNYGYSAVLVTPKSGTSGQWLDYGADWTHTYSKTNTSGNFTANVTFGGGSPVSGSVGGTVNVSSNQESWQKADTNAVKF